MKRAFPLAAALCALALTGCGKAAVTGQSARTVQPLPASTVPATIAGLTTQAESVSGVLKMQGGGVLTYADKVGYWSLRENKLVQGTLQITHLGSSARVNDPKFVATLVQSLMVPDLATRIGRYDVYLGQGTTVNNAVWLEGSYLLELSVRPTYVFPRTLLEGAVEVTV